MIDQSTTRYLYDYRLTIGAAVAPKTKLKTTGNGIPFSEVTDYNKLIPEQNKTDQNNAFMFSDLQISFNISKDDTPDPNNSTITLYNLSDDTVDYLCANIKDKVVVKLEAGYKGQDLKQLVLTTVYEVNDKFEGNTRTTELKLADGVANTREAITSRTYAKGVPHSIIRKDLIKDLGLPTGNVSNWDSTSKTLMARAYTGPTHQLLQTLSEKNNHDYHIQDGRVNIIPKGKRLNIQSAYISPDTGLIGSPEPLGKDFDSKNSKYVNHKQGYIKKNGKWSNENKIAVDGIKFKCQLDGGIFVGSTVYVESRNYSGAYKVTKLTHNGDYQGGQWTTDVECIYVEATIVD